MLKIPAHVWNRQGRGFICLASNGEKWHEMFFRWPEERKKAHKYIEAAQKKGRDVYWSLAVYQKPRRSEEAVKKLNLLWADLDNNPERVGISDIDPKPSMLWRTSTGNYQAVWLLEKSINVNHFKEINKNLTYRLGADKGCWNVTRVFRVPGSINFKRGGEEGKVIYARKVTHNIHSFIHREKQQVTGKGEEQAIDEILYPYAEKIPLRAWQLLHTPPSQATKDRDRSARLWELQRLLEEARIPKDIIRQTLEQCVWNKFAGRRDEKERLDSQIEKTAEEGPEETHERRIVSYTQLLGNNINRGEWLVKDWWEMDSYGIVSGQPKTYKSVITTDLAVSVASGRPFLGKYEVVNRGSVLIIQEENSPWIVQDRLKKIANSKGLLISQVEKKGTNRLSIEFPPKLPIYMLNNENFIFTEEEDRLFIERAIMRIKPKLVILDPLYLMLGDADENSAKELRPILNWLKKVSETYRCSVLIIHHWRKGGQSTRGGQRMLGSTTFHAWTQSAFYLELKDDNRVEVEREFRSFPKPARVHLTIHMDDPGYLGYSVEVEEEEILMEKLRQFFINQQAASIKEITEYLNCTRYKAKKMVSSLTKEGYLELYKQGKKGKSSPVWRVKSIADE